MMDLLDIWSGWPIKKIPKLSDHEYGAERRKYERAKKTHKEQIKTLEILWKSIPGLVNGESGIYLTEDKVRVLLKKIHKDCNGYVIRQRHNFFTKGLMEGRKKLDWRTPIPYPMIVLPREPSPFTTAKFEILASLRFLEEKFLNSLADNSFYDKEDSEYALRAKNTKLKDVSSSQLVMGQFLFSAIINGALLHKVWINALFDGLLHGDTLSDKSSLWLSLTHTTGEGECAVTLRRRWFPDPLTSSLLVRMIRKDTLATILNTEGQLHNPIFYLNRFFASLGVNTKNRPTLKQLISAAKTKLALSIPPYLIAYAGSLNQSQSLSDTCWLRLTSDVVPKEPPGDIPETNGKRVVKNSAKQLVLPSHRKIPNQLQQLRVLHSCFSNDHYKTAPTVGVITKRIEQFIAKGNLCGMLELLAQWSLVMMRNKRITGKKSKPQSMNAYLYAIAKHLIVYGTQKPAKLSADDWITLFDKVRESSPSPQRLNYKSKRLRAFNDFLVSTYNYPWVHVELVSSDVRNIKASIISSNEYKVVKQRIQNNVLQPLIMRNINSLLTTLGFRCGLRRNEALKIEMSDLQTEMHYGKELILSVREEIFIRNNRHGTVKSHKSTRRLPLHILLTTNEMNELNNWVNQRKQELADKEKEGALLFCHSKNDTTLLSYRETFDHIQEVMRQVTKDPTLTFHSLRHSFINILLLSILQDDLPETLLETWSDIAKEKYRFDKIKALRNAILLSPRVEPSRRFLYVVSQFCGHIDPKETLLTYIHVLDWILGSFSRKSSPFLTKEQQANILGVKLNSLKVIKSKEGLKGDVTAQDILELLIKQTKNLPVVNYENMIPLNSSPTWESLKPERHENIVMLLYHIFEDISKGTAAENITEQYRVSTDEIIRWEAIAKKLVRLTTPTNTKKSKLLTKPRTQAKSPKTINHRLFYPKKPHRLLDQQEATSICNKIIDLYGQNKDHVVSGLQLYLSREDSSLPEMSFASADEAKLFTSFLRELGIAKKRIMVTLLLTNPAEKEQYVEFWSQLLDLEEKIFAVSKGTYKMKKHPHGKVTLWITNLPKEKWVRHAKHLKDNQRRKFHTAAGLRFALFMAAVYLDILPVQNEAVH